MGPRSLAWAVTRTRDRPPALTDKMPSSYVKRERECKFLSCERDGDKEIKIPSIQEQEWESEEREVEEKEKAMKKKVICKFLWYKFVRERQTDREDEVYCGEPEVGVPEEKRRRSQRAIRSWQTISVEESAWISFLLTHGRLPGAPRREDGPDPSGRWHVTCYLHLHLLRRPSTLFSYHLHSLFESAHAWLCVCVRAREKERGKNYVTEVNTPHTVLIAHTLRLPTPCSKLSDNDSRDEQKAKRASMGLIFLARQTYLIFPLHSFQKIWEEVDWKVHRFVFEK